MSAKTDAVTSQTAAQANKTRTGTRHDVSISAGATGEIAGVSRETGGDAGGIALIEQAADLYSVCGLCATELERHCEPTPDPCQEGDSRGAEERLLPLALPFPSWEGLGVGSRRVYMV